MNPTTDEIIKIIDGKHWVSEEDYFEAWGRLQGRLDIYEEWLDYQLGIEENLSNNLWLREEINKIKEVLK